MGRAAAAQGAVEEGEHARFVLDGREPVEVGVGGAGDDPELLRSGRRGVETPCVRERRARIVVLTMHDDPAYVRAALAAGASGYLAKTAADTALIGAIRAVHRGRLFLDVANMRALEPLVAPGAAPHGLPAPIERLSAREREVLVGVAQGNTNQAIADRLHLSVKTVESYRSRLMQKLGLTSRAEITRLAIELGLLGAAGGEPPET